MTKTKPLLIDESSQQGPVPEIGPAKLPAAIRFHRKQSGLSQAELATLAGVGKAVIFDIEKGKQTVQMDTLQKVLAALNIQIIFQSPLMEKFVRTDRENS